MLRTTVWPVLTDCSAQPLILGTQSSSHRDARCPLQGPFINIDRLDLKKYAQRPALAKVLCDYVIYQLHNPRKGLELCALATQVLETGVGLQFIDL
eukprot:COSAG05_NODE_2306_length_3249_cov_2.568889_2_plen_96_part_00